jgi:RNA polymerase sigma-70 factor (ECF subfamily)
VAYHKIVDCYRQTTRHPQVTLDSITDSLLEDETHSPEQLAIQQETHQELLQNIQQLPIFEQQILRLRYGDGLPFAEIARLLDKKETAVRKVLSRTLARLRTIYKDRKGETTC